LRSTLDLFFKFYTTIDKKWEKAKDDDEKFEISLQIMKRIFNIKSYEVES
jgi:hypothetical protein